MKQNPSPISSGGLCPHDGSPGQAVQLVTLNSLLNWQALERLIPMEIYQFCPSSECEVVYFNDSGQIFKASDLRVSVFQKSKADDTPVCYCFGLTRGQIAMQIAKASADGVAASEGAANLIIADIIERTRTLGCDCMSSNPQGSCCLKNVRKVALLSDHVPAKE